MEDKVMEQKKTMNLWQMIALVVLLAGVTISMFFPVLNPTGQKMVSSFEKFANRYEEDENIGKSCKTYLKEIEDDSKREDREVQCDSYLDNLEAADEKDDGALLFPANGMEFLSKSFILDGGMDKINQYQDEKEDDLSDYQKSVLSIYNSYNKARIAMGIVYFMPLLLIILTILAYALKWNKNIMALVNMIASLIGTCISAAIYFIAPKMVSVEGDSISSIIHKFIKRDYFLDLGSKYEDFSSDLASALWNALRGNGFLITAVIFFLVLVIAVITMAVQGNENAYSNSYYEPTPGPMPIPVPDPEPTPFLEPTPAPIPQPAPVPEPIPQPPVQQLGRVRCIEGNANVPGYKFPEENKIIVGANPTRCQIVINGAPHVSNIHCSIRYNAQKNTYIVKDHSSNGTFVNGARLPKDQAMEYPTGTILSLADGSNKLRLGD